MKLYCVFCGVDYEGGYIAGVFSTEEKALAFITNNNFTKVHISSYSNETSYYRTSRLHDDSYCKIVIQELDEEIPIYEYKHGDE